MKIVLEWMNALQYIYKNALGLVFAIYLIAGQVIYAQQLVTIKGVISDGQTGELLSYVTVSVKNKPIGVLTDNYGKFEFKAKVKSGDSLKISYVGYAQQTYPLTNKSTQQFSIKLVEVNYPLREILITADPNPGKTLMKKVISQNRMNNPANQNRMRTRRWEIKEIDVYDPKADSAHVTKGILFGDKARIYAALRKPEDTLVKQTPVYFSEKISDYELTRFPFSESENIVAVHTTGFETDKLLESLVKWNAGDINLYSDWVLLFNKNFVSPVGTDAFNYYNYYIVDSVTFSKGSHNITFQAIPKDWRDNVFTGYFTVNDSSFALVSADLRLSKKANINFIENIRIQQKYVPAPDVSNGSYHYTLSESILSLQYLASLENLGIPIPVSLGDKILMCKMKVKNSAIQLNNDKQADFSKSGALITSRNLMDTGHDADYWNNVRPDTLSRREQSIYVMSDLLKKDFKAKTREKIVSTILTGVYYIDNKFYIGPISSMLSYNQLEGVRIRLSVRTMEGIFPKTGMYGYVAYGLKDEKIKSNAGIRQVWQSQPYSRSQLAYTSDYDVILDWYDQSDKDNLINSILRKSHVPYYRVYNKKLSLNHDQQIGSNLLVHAGLNYQSLDPSFHFLFPNPAFISNDRTPSQPVSNHIVPLFEFTIGMRYAWHESAKMYNYTRYPLVSKYPVFIISYTHGFKISRYHFNYQKWSINLNHNTHITPKIEYQWDLEFGRIFGTTPSLILHQPSGSDSWVVSHRVFNLITPYEFTLDRYVELHSRIHLGGILFDRIPIINKLQWRERIIFNSFWGGLSDSNKQFNIAQNAISAGLHPYVELGVGIDNVFHLFSVNYIRRIDYLDSPGALGNFDGLFFGMKVLF